MVNVLAGFACLLTIASLIGVTVGVFRGSPTLVRYGVVGVGIGIAVFAIMTVVVYVHRDPEAA